MLHRQTAQDRRWFPPGGHRCADTVPSVSSPEVSAAITVLVFSHRPEVREAITMAIGRRPAPDLPRVRFVEAGGVADVLAAMDAGGVDLAIRGGAAPGRPLAGHVVAGRRGARPPPRPADRRRDRRRRAAPHPRRPARARLRRPGWETL